MSNLLQIIESLDKLQVAQSNFFRYEGASIVEHGIRTLKTNKDVLQFLQYIFPRLSPLDTMELVQRVKAGDSVIKIMQEFDERKTS